MSELLDTFLQEAPELLDTATSGLLELERAPGDAELVNEVFRAAHTLKGSSALFDMPSLTSLVHAAEDVLDGVREGEIGLTGTLVDVLMDAFDLARAWLGDIEADGALPADADEAGARRIAVLRGFLGEAGGDGPAQASGGGPLPDWARELLAGGGEGLVALRYTPDPGAFFRGEDPLAIVRTIPGIRELRIGREGEWPQIGDLDEYECALVFTVLAEATADELEPVLRYVRDEVEEHRAGDGAGASPTATPSSAPGTPEPPPPGEAPELVVQSRQPGSRTIKVDQGKVDHLLELVGELAVAKNGLPFLARRAEDGDDPVALARALKDHHAVVNRLVEELQEAVMDMRMVPVATVFQRFPRLVRDVSRRLGKEVRLEMDGEDTTADKDVLEQLADPLVHLVRNSLDHGLEDPGGRSAAGKPTAGLLTLRASHAAEGVRIEICDDGRGIDPAAIARAAVAKGVIDEDRLATISDAEAVDLVFAPGFSTAGQVSDLSGRGVGMDAVRAAVARVGGAIAIDSTPGQGTTVSLSVPLSVAVTKLMVVRAAGQRFGVPVDQVRETVRVTRSDLGAVAGQEALSRRGDVLPVVDLASTLGLAAPSAEPGDPDEDLRLLVVRSGKGEAAMAVDRFDESIDVMAKPLDGILAETPGLSGTALLGDGHVLLILDTKELLEHAC